MTPTKKARDLVNKYTLFSGGLKSLSDGAKRHAKQCSIICVDEILNSNPIVPLEYMLESEALDKAREYWQSVKTEIEKL